MSGYTAFDAPLDSSGARRGEARAPAALRAAGLLRRLGATDGGEVDAHIRDATRDATTGVIGAADVRRATKAIAERVRSIRESGTRPLVVGGDCTLLLGVCSGIPEGTALCFVDGHADFMDGESSPTGEAADMDLAILTGHGPPGLLDRPRLVVPGDVVLLGHRPGEIDPLVALENDRIDPAIHAHTAPQIRELGPTAVGKATAARLAGRAVWLHIDLDVLDADEFPAVTYAQPAGLTWAEVRQLLLPVTAAPGIVGVSVADFNPDRDPGGRHAARVVGELAALL